MNTGSAPPSVLESESTAPATPAERPPEPKRRVGTALILVPVLFIAWMGWRHRWMCDDAFINFRVVKQILAGHGPVFNAGDRVEVATSPLWLGILTAFDAITPIPIEWIAAITSICATAGGLALAMFGTQRALRSMGVTATFLPLGGLVYAVLPPAWDFATSGLEVGLSVLWLGLSWWLLTRRLAQSTLRVGGAAPAPWKPWWVPVVLGLGPLVRPDFLIFSGAFLLALLLLAGQGRRWTSHLAAVGIALALPIATELFRMGYYGNLVPNTAIAKEGALSNWRFGWGYIRDFVGPHLLLIPLIVLAVIFLAPLARRSMNGANNVRVLFGLTVAAGLVHGFYVVRVGGDYMHGRMFLPTLFVLLLPVSVVAARTWQWVAVLAVAVWATASAAVLRPSYSASIPPGTFNPVGHAISTTNFISDERLVQIRFSGVRHPVTLADFSAHDQWADVGFSLKAMLNQGDRGLLLDQESDFQSPSALIPLRASGGSQIVAFAGAVGVYAYAAGTSVDVFDRFGIVDAFAAHQKLLRAGRPGHDKSLPLAWTFARVAAPGAPIPASITPQDAQAAERALACGDFPELTAATESPLTAGRFFSNIGHAFSLYGFRFDREPQIAARELCGN